MSEYHTMYHDGYAKAFFIETPTHERLAIFPYGKGQGDVSIVVAKEAAMKALDFFNGQKEHESEKVDEVELPPICRTCAKCGNPCDRGIVGVEVGDFCESYTRKGGEA